MFKKDLRSKYYRLRNTISPEKHSALSLDIANILLEIPIWSFDYYHVFLSIAEKGEIDTSFILSVLQGKDKNVVVPKTKTDSTFVSYLLTDHMRIKKNKWGIPEPVDGVEIPPSKIDVVFLPLLAFDEKGNRVGYGKGFYDNFLKQCRPNVLKVGLSIFSAEKEITDIRKDDVAMDYCVTPEKIYRF